MAQYILLDTIMVVRYSEMVTLFASSGCGGG